MGSRLNSILARLVLIAGAAWMALVPVAAEDAVEQMPNGLVENQGVGPPYEIPVNGTLRTQELFRPPLDFTLIAKIPSGGIRIGYAHGSVRFGYVSKLNANCLRVELPDLGRLIIPDKGKIPFNQNVAIRWVMTATDLSIYLDGDLRFHHSGDFSALEDRIFITSCTSFAIIESLKTQQLAGGETNTPAPSPVAPPPPAPVVSASPATDHEVPTVCLTAEQARAVVLIQGDKAEGTGFLIKMKDGPVVVTNLHVLANNPNLKITTTSGTLIPILSMKGAADRDLALLAIKDAGYSYLQMVDDVSQTALPGDEVITPGNSEGGEVMLNTTGKILGLGPERIEFDNPIYHGNSGGPVFHTKSGKVLGVVTEAMKVDTSDDLDKTSFASRNSAIGAGMRYFGLRLDTVTTWLPVEAPRFQTETTFLDQFDQASHALDSYLNAPDDDKPEDNTWRNNPDIVQANTAYFNQATGGDAATRLDAARQWLSALDDVANLNVESIQDPRNFYPFDQEQARQDLAFRQAIKTELDNRSQDLSQLESLPRKN